jgi:hypothetical protein
MSEGLSRNFGHMLVLSLPLLGKFDAKTVAEDLSDGLEGHTLAFWVAEDNEHPAKEANPTVEPKGAAWRHSFHHGQEGRGDDDVGAPAGHSILESSALNYRWYCTLLTSIVPTARTSRGISSVPIHAIVATPDAKKAT